MVETNGAWPDGQRLSDAIKQFDENTNGYPSYFVINCAHPDHFVGVLRDAPWARRIRGVRANALGEVTPNSTQPRNWIRETRRN
jgi:S-methylmethionine-dependent homocysteine/selenocysteine methylase